MENKPQITDHAILRYIERIHGIDIEQLRQHLLTEKVILGIKQGARKIKTDECVLIVRDGVVVTVVKNSRRVKIKGLTRAKRELQEEDFFYETNA